MADWELAVAKQPLRRIEPCARMIRMIRVKHAEALADRRLRLMLTDGSVVERDVQDLLWGALFERLRTDDALFRRARAAHGTVAWPGNIDLAPETLIWDGPDPEDDDPRRPAPFLRPTSPTGVPTA